LSSSDPSREFATDVVRKLRSAGYIALWAGGCVRDLLLGRGAKDFDVATNATPEQVRELFGKKRTLAVGQSFGVIIVLAPNRDAEQVEVATFRTEGGYHDGRRPTQVVYSTPEEDAQRRDFTINGMFYDPIEGQVHDYVGGQADLQRGIVRAIGNPHERMTEDKLRMLRAVRFTATLGFDLDPVTADAVRQMAPELIVVSAERIAQELRKVLSHRSRVQGYELLSELGLLRVILPEVAGAGSSTLTPSPSLGRRAELDQTVETLRQLPESASFELALAAILQQLPAPVQEPKTHHDLVGTVWAVTRRLKLSAEEMTAIVWLVGHLTHWNDAPSQTAAQLKRLLAHPLSSELRALVRAVRQAACLPLEPIDFVDDYVQRHTPEEINPRELITGKDLIERGLAPGPRFKELLDQIRDAQLNGEIASRLEALQLLEQLAP
jgi:poly(A) polymerase